MPLFIPITKVDVAQRLVYGTLTEEIADKSGEILDYASSKPAFEEWSKAFFQASAGKSLGNVRAMHGSVAAGKFTDISYDDDAKKIEGCAKIVDDGEWNKVLEGVYTGFSIGGGYARRWQDPNDPKLKRYTPVLSEVSIVDNPCVPTATFEFIKSDGSRELRKFITPSHKEDSMDPKAIADAREALAKGTAADEQKALVVTADAALLKGAQDADAKGEATEEQKTLLKVVADAVPALVNNGKAVKPKTAPMQKWLADDGTPFDSKREAEVHNLHLEKKAELAPGLAEMDALLKGAPENAGEGTAPTEDEIKAAADKAAADELAKQAEKDAADKAAADALAKAGAGTEKKAAPVKKSLYQIGRLAELLSSLRCVQSDVEWEQMWEQDADSELPAKFKSLVADMCQLLVTLVGEETKELIEEGGETEILEMAAGLPQGHAAALGKFVAEMRPYEEADLAKPEIKANAQKFVAVKNALEKAGARHSKSDKEGLMALHKSASDHIDAIEKCFKGMGIMDDDAEDKDTKKMSKLLDALQKERDNGAALTQVLSGTNESLQKAIPVIKDLQKQNAELVARMEHLEKQPAAAKGHVRTISKSQDGGATGENGGETEAEFKAKLDKLSPVARSRELMKLAMSNPMDLPAL